MKPKEKDRLFQALTRSIGLFNVILLLIVIHIVIGMVIGFGLTVFRVIHILASPPII